MLVSFRHKLVFLANPRCGSHSICRALLEYPDVMPAVPSAPHAHSSLRSVERSLRRPLDDFFVFTTVRNPWERAISIYHYGLKTPQSIWHGPAVESGSFQAFCRHAVLEGVFRPGLMESFPHPEGPFDVRSIGSDARRCFLASVFDVADFPTLETCLGERGMSVSIPHINSTEHRPYAEYYDEASVARIAFLFESDIELMGYRAPLPTPAPLI